MGSNPGKTCVSASVTNVACAHALPMCNISSTEQYTPFTLLAVAHFPPSYAVVRTLAGHTSNVRSIDFHPYGEFVASGSLDTTLKASGRADGVVVLCIHTHTYIHVYVYVCVIIYACVHMLVKRG